MVTIIEFYTYTKQRVASSYRRRLRRLMTITTPITAAADTNNAQTVVGTITFTRSSPSVGPATAASDTKNKIKNILPSEP